MEDGACGMRLARTISGPARLESTAGDDTDREQKKPEYDNTDGLRQDLDFE